MTFYPTTTPFLGSTIFTFTAFYFTPKWNVFTSSLIHLEICFCSSEYYIGFFILPNIFPLQPGPLRQTFTHNPLQQSTPSIAAATKSAKAKQAPPATAAKKRPWEETIGWRRVTDSLKAQWIMRWYLLREKCVEGLVDRTWAHRVCHKCILNKEQTSVAL